MGGGLESRWVGRVYGADGAVHKYHKNKEQKNIITLALNLSFNNLIQNVGLVNQK